MSIPGWTATGLLPPIWPANDGASPNRSPYSTTLTDIAQHFAMSSERIAILKGLVKFRAALFNLGITKGFQWLDGSFMEQVEITEGRSPNDIDVVTFFELPEGISSQTDFLKTAPPWLRLNEEKDLFNVDAYYIQLGERMDESYVNTISYWYSMWSHQRNATWKGFLQVNLDKADDAQAANLLSIAELQGGVE